MSTQTWTIDDITVDAYRNADISDKAAMRRIVHDAQKAALAPDVADVDVARVQALFALEAALVPVRSEKSETDYVGLIARRAAVLRLASEFIATGMVRPDGVPDETDLSGVSDAFHDIIDNQDESPDSAYQHAYADAMDIAARKVTKSANTFDVAEIITNAFKDVSTGTFLTIRQICAKSGYPHDGAVAARLFPKSAKTGKPLPCTVDGIVPVDRTATNVRGARKA